MMRNRIYDLFFLVLLFVILCGVSQLLAPFSGALLDALARNSSEWERLAQAKNKHSVKLSKEVKVERGAAPAAGFESTNRPPLLTKAAAPADFLDSIASARQEVQALFEIAQIGR